MTTPQTEPYEELTAHLERICTSETEYLEAKVRLDGDMVRSGVLGTILILPAGLMVTDTLQWLGYLYTGVYVSLMLVPSAILVVMLFDSVRVIMGRQAIFLHVILGSAKRGQALNVKPDPLRWLLVEANLFVNVWRISYILAWNHNHQEMRRVQRDADEYAARLEDSGRPSSRVIPKEPRLRRPKPPKPPSHFTGETPVPVG